jgi:hypothetical protein
MSNQPKFVDLVLNGEIVDPEIEIDEWIQRWHASDNEEPLHDWLGMTWEEYSLFVEKPQFLKAIFAARAYHLSISDAVSLENDCQGKLAARGVPADDVPILRRWLEATGRL